MYNKIISVFNFILIFIFQIFIITCSSITTTSLKPVNEIQNEFFNQKYNSNLAFLVFISEKNYIVKQIQYLDKIKRTEDKESDEEKKEFFAIEHNKINFKDFRLEGILNVELNPQGNPLNIKYVPGGTPKTWQASKHFIQDLSRFHFDFINPGNGITRFSVKYLWIIKGGGGNNKQKAIEYLKKEKKS